MTAPTTTNTPNLRETKREMAAAKRAPAKKAPAKAAAPKAADKPAVTKLRWELLGERTPKGVESSATNGDREYEIRGSGDAWTAMVLVEGGSYGKGYNAVTAHNKAAQK
jgi:hypothetical protein